MAPAATGKSFIGCEVIRSVLEKDLLGSMNVRLRISTGDHREPIRPEESELIVATYESFAALVRRTSFAPGTVIAGEIHLVADDHRGPVVEGVLSRLLASGRIASLCGLSAVVEKGKDPKALAVAKADREESDPELDELISETMIDTDLYGRRLYENMAAYWPTADKKPSASGYKIEYGRSD